VNVSVPFSFPEVTTERKKKATTVKSPNRLTSSLSQNNKTVLHARDFKSLVEEK